jgi:molybdate transport system regulatory protein
MRTSARNTFVGKVSHIAQDGMMVEVGLHTLGGLDVLAVITSESFKNLDLTEGSVVMATVKAPGVFLVEKEKGVKTSARNIFTGKVVSVKNSEIAAEVIVDLAEGTKICSLLTNDSAKELELAPGKEIAVMFKAFDVTLNAE